MEGYKDFFFLILIQKMNSTYLKKALTGIVYPPTQGRNIRISVTPPPPQITEMGGNQNQKDLFYYFPLFSTFFFVCPFLHSFLLLENIEERENLEGGGSASPIPPPLHTPMHPHSHSLCTSIIMGQAGVTAENKHGRMMNGSLIPYTTISQPGATCVCVWGGGNMYSRGNIQMDKFKIRN